MCKSSIAFALIPDAGFEVCLLFSLDAGSMTYKTNVNCHQTVKPF